MEILLVDDEIYTIRILQTAIDWKSHQVEQVWSALGVAKAREILQENQIDLVICDIEMPKESGLDLLRWIRENKYDTEIILLTCHTEFAYAKQALNLGAYDYCVKPINVEDIEKVAVGALMHIQENRKMRKAWEEKDYLEKTRKVVETSFWRDTLEGRNGSSPDAIMKHAKENNVSLELNDTFCMALFSTKFVEQETMDEAVDFFHITRNFFDKLEAQAVLLEERDRGKWTVLLCNLPAEDFCRICDDYLKMFHEIINIRIIGCLYTDLYCEELVSSYGKMYETEKMMTFYQESMWNVREVEQKKLVNVELDADMEQLLYSGQFGEFAKRLEEDLKRKQWKHPVSVSALHTLRADICQSLDVYLKGRGILAHTLFMDEEMCRRMNESTLSVEHMVHFVRFLARFVPYEDNVTDITNAVKKYIFQHLSEEIARDSIAAALYMNGDYISRVFKRDTGMSISQYVNKERINQAKLLMVTTDLPMGDVADAVGYTNFSYFSKLFKQFVNCTPREYKLRMKGEGREDL